MEIFHDLPSIITDGEEKVFTDGFKFLRMNRHLDRQNRTKTNTQNTAKVILQYLMYLNVYYLT